MDIKCLHCGEPWDLHHLLHDADPEEEDWNFGATRTEVRECPACAERGPRPDKERAFEEATIIQLMGDDVDGAAAMLQDLDCFMGGE